jgi:phage terminase large subunit-like protein
LAAEWVVWEALRDPNSRSAVIAPTYSDVRGVAFEGDSGILNIAQRFGIISNWESTRCQITLVNGSLITGYSAEIPGRLRGPQFHRAWLDESAIYTRPEAIDMLRLGLRLGRDPRMIVTTTPRPVPHLKKLLKEDQTVVIRGRTFDNAANLAPAFLEEVERLYGGTRLGRQELEGEVLEDVEGSLWTWEMLRSETVPLNGSFVRVVVGVDPAISTNESSDETGIVVAAIDDTGKFWVLADASGKYTPSRWAGIAVELAEQWGAEIVAETNQGGQMVESVLRSTGFRGRVTRVHASRGKAIRAEPVVALYEQGRVVHAPGLNVLEDQMTAWIPGIGQSPDRVDALVWAMSALVARRPMAKAQSFQT